MATTIQATANHRNRTFTIRFKDENGKTFKKYRTLPMSRSEFESELHNTENDWKRFMKSDDYYLVK